MGAPALNRARRRRVARAPRSAARPPARPRGPARHALAPGPRRLRRGGCPAGAPACPAQLRRGPGAGGARPARPRAVALRRASDPGEGGALPRPLLARREVARRGRRGGAAGCDRGGRTARGPAALAVPQPHHAPAECGSHTAHRRGVRRHATGRCHSHLPGAANVAGTPPAGVSYDLRTGRCGRAPRAPVGAPRPSRAGPRRSRVRGAGHRSGRGCRPGARPSPRGRGGRR